MIIAVASGKGGTGKTTVATNLAVSLNNVQLIDCDVEEPNCNVFMKMKMKKIDEVKVKIPKVDIHKCDFCGKCSEFCQYNALAVLQGNVMVFPDLCHSCGGCKLVCTKNAITEIERVIGRIDKGNGSIDFYQGIIEIGEPRATPVIKALKSRIDKKKIVILDAPPGTSCPLIETIKGVDFVLLVTEPTPFGLYDLKITVDVVRRVGIKCGVLLNRYLELYNRIRELIEDETAYDN